MIIDLALQNQLKFSDSGQLLIDKENLTPPKVSVYTPNEETRNVTAMILDCFRQGNTNLRTPRREFNDLSLLSRSMIDQMSFNIYQPNNGQAYEGDPQGAWKSHAMRPIVRAKVMSVAAHITARMLFPKVFARNEQSESQDDAATVMRDLIEYASDENSYAKNTLYAVISACVNPYSVMHLEYAEAYRTIKTEKGSDGKWKTEEILDEDNSGFTLTPVPCDEFYFEDFYQEDVQKQGWLIWRRVQSYSVMKAKYGKFKNFEYVTPGYQVLYNDANVTFYEVYDSNLRGSLCEEILFYSKPLDLFIPIVNGVMMTEPDNPNPRIDKNYPFIKFGYEVLNEGRCFAYKSLAFKMQPDADIINTLYPLIIDGTYLSVMPPLIIAGEETIGADVVVPGVATTVSNPQATVTPLRVAQDLGAGLQTLAQVENSINQSTEEPLTFDHKETAYARSLQQQQAQTLLGPFVMMVADYVKQYGNLLKSDIIQYLTIADVSKIVDNGELVFKTLVVPERQTEGGTKSRKIQFKGDLPDDVTEDEELEMSYDILEEQKGEKSGEEIYKVNPSLFRNLKFLVSVSPDVITPMSDDMEKAMGLELFDRAIGLPGLGVNVDLEQVSKDFLFKLYPGAKNNVDKYFKEEPMIDPMQMAMQEQGQLNQPIAQAGNSPMNAMKNNPLSNFK
jgi:hypothetical protein